MTLEDIGYSPYFEQQRIEKSLSGFVMGRVIAEHKERYIVKTEAGDQEAEITGNLRFTAQRREDFPAVGDWVALTPFYSGMSIIHQVLPRQSMISRQAAGASGEIQIIATNIDYAFIVQAIDRDFNINRLERYLTICHGSQVKPIIVLTKIDLIDASQLDERVTAVRNRIPQAPILVVSNETREGVEQLIQLIEKGKTYCMLGSSGVGKSTLLNTLSGKDVMKTGNISSQTQKGRHVTSHRELIVLDQGGILIDNPGMREVGIVDPDEGLNTTFDRIASLSQNCRFADCTHIRETGCAVKEAVENGDLDRRSYENYLKMEREKAHFEASLAERRKKDKDFGKMVRNVKKDIKKIKR